MAKRGFVLGNHEFLHPSVNGPLSRLDDPKTQILGAPPPTYLQGMVRESTTRSPAAKNLLKGEFCGHGEPTMTIFDVIIDAVEELEVGAVSDSESAENGRNLVLLAVRKPGGNWRALFRREWEDRHATLSSVKSNAVSAKEALAIHPDVLRGRVSIGFEYPCDADSQDAVCWIAIDVLETGKRKPMCVVNAELA